MGLICLELLIVALATAVGAQDVPPSVAAVCPAGLSSTSFVRHQSCYEFNGVEKTWMQARAYCHERGGRLVCIMDADVQAWLSKTAARLWPRQNGVWIGLNDRSQSGVFVWDDYGVNSERQISYSNWASGYPSNGLLSGNCVHMRSDKAWQWLENSCSLAPFLVYNYICEYRIVANLSINVTSPREPVVTSGAEETPSVERLTPDTLSARSLTPEAEHWFTTEYSLEVLSSSASKHARHDAGAMASKSDVALPLSVSLAAVVGVVALIAVALVVRRRQQHQRSRQPKCSTVSWTRTDDDEITMADNPVYGDAAQLAVYQATATHGGGSDDRLLGRPVSTSNAETNYAVSVVRSQRDSDCLSDHDTGAIYAEPSAQEQSAAIASEPAMQYQQNAYMDTASLLKLQQPGTSVDEAASTDNRQQHNHAQQLYENRSTQDDYKPFVTEWAPYENLQKPDTRNV